MKSKRRGKLLCGVLLLHDNAPYPHLWCCDVCYKSFPCAPFARPSIDFCLFPLLKEHLRCTKFSSDHSIIAASVEDCPGARTGRWTLQHRSYRNNGIRALKLWRLRRKINCSQLLCHVSLYMRRETFWTTLIIMFFSGIYYFSIFPLCVYRRQFWRGIVLAAVCLSVSVCEQDN